MNVKFSDECKYYLEMKEAEVAEIALSDVSSSIQGESARL